MILNNWNKYFNYGIKEQFSYQSRFHELDI